MTGVKYLLPQITNRSIKVGQVGMGYVGLPVACLVANAGFSTVGIDLDRQKLELIEKGISPISGIEPGLSELLEEVVNKGRLSAGDDYALLADAQIILVAVDTPVQEDTHKPLYTALLSALKNIGCVISTGTLVIIESTVAPGTTSELVIPTLEQASGMVCGTDFFVGHCPERVMPGRLLHNLRSMDRVIGGISPDVSEVMAAFYRTYVEGSLDLVDPLTAELVKTGENAYRDVNIAFANEMALICDQLGADVWSVRELINKSPNRVMLMPGAGVGGHCIPKDPWLLASSVEGLLDTPLIKTARLINDKMPFQVFRWIEQALNDLDLTWTDAQIAVLGYAYLENSDDIRNSPTAALVQYLEKKQAQFVLHDPFVKPFQGDVAQRIEHCDIVVGMVKHNEYVSLNLAQFSLRAVIDARGIWQFAKLKKLDIAVYGIPLV